MRPEADQNAIRTHSFLQKNQVSLHCIRYETRKTTANQYVCQYVCAEPVISHSRKKMAAWFDASLCLNSFCAKSAQSTERKTAYPACCKTALLPSYLTSTKDHTWTPDHTNTTFLRFDTSFYLARQAPLRPGCNGAGYCRPHCDGDSALAVRPLGRGYHRVCVGEFAPNKHAPLTAHSMENTVPHAHQQQHGSHRLCLFSQRSLSCSSCPFSSSMHNTHNMTCSKTRVHLLLR